MRPAQGQTGAHQRRQPAEWEIKHTDAAVDPVNEPRRSRPAADFPKVLSAEARWRAALRTAPLESVQPLVGRWASLARVITGRAYTSYTSGPATRQALRTAGALGATTGSVIHLSRVPSDRVEDAAVITHELAHSRTPVQRPRFMLADHSTHNEEERAAQRTARLAGAGGVAAGRFLPGLIDTLPVTGIGGLIEAARTAAGPFAGSQTAAAGLAAAAGFSPGSLPGFAETAQAGGSALSGQVLANPSAGGLQAAGGGPPPPGGGQMGTDLFGSGPRDTAAGASLPGLNPPPTAGTGRPPRESPMTALGVADFDRLLEALEDNVLRDVERRGGRYEGVF